METSEVEDNMPVSTVDNVTVSETGERVEVFVVTFFLVVLILTSIIGNILVCIAVATDKKLRKLSNLFLVSLAIADLLVSAFVMPFPLIKELGALNFGLTFCKIWISSDVMCSTASIVNLCAISLDRYIHIKDPLQYTEWITRKSVPLTIAVIWITSAFISFLPISLDLHSKDSMEVEVEVSAEEAEPENHTCALDFNPSYSIISSFISFFLPCLIMLMIYFHVYRFARYHMKAIKEHSQPLLRLRRMSIDVVAQADAAVKKNGVSAVGVALTTETPLNGNGVNGNHGLCPNSNVVRPMVTASNMAVTSAAAEDKKANGAADRSTDTDAKFFKRKFRRKKGKAGAGKGSKLITHDSPLLQEHKAAITIGIIMGVFMICWTPFFIVNVISGFCRTCISPNLFKVLTWLGYSNSVFNPIIYSIFNVEFREAFHRILTQRPHYCFLFNRPIDV